MNLGVLHHIPKAAITPPLRLTRALVDRLPPRTDEEGPVRASSPDAGFHARTAARLLAETDTPGVLWVFAAGSLIWNPRMGVAERRVAHLSGWHRAFCIGPTKRFRGSPSAPGLMMSIDRGGDCTGVVLRMQADDLQAALVSLLQKEPPTPPEWVIALTAQGPVKAIAFTADPDWVMYIPEPPLEALVQMFATAVGTVGTMAEYLLNTVTELERAGIYDPHLWQLQALLADRLALLPEP
jgi:glutathione-specific gamma-glutamylcyclotransferase